MTMRTAALRTSDTTTAPTTNRAAADRTPRSERGGRRIHIALWIVQALLALLFLFAGIMKLVMPLDAMTGQTPLPGLFLRFLGVAEVLGGLGLILPGLFRILPILTPFAALGLGIIMVGAVSLTLAGGAAAATVPFATGILCAFVAVGRWRIARLR
jgi:uncharacterized membrane protein YphA (DoxX/SURF4 family)